MILNENQIAQLGQAARNAAHNAYAPYSKFMVGAAVLDESGRLFSGCNVENISYGLTICAERNAVFSAVAAGAKNIRALSIYTPTEALTTPCGACRQVLAEFDRSGVMEIHLFNDRGGHAIHRLADLLPHGFHF